MTGWHQRKGWVASFPCVLDGGKGKTSLRSSVGIGQDAECELCEVLPGQNPTFVLQSSCLSCPQPDFEGCTKSAQSDKREAIHCFKHGGVVLWQMRTYTGLVCAHPIKGRARLLLCVCVWVVGVCVCGWDNRLQIL